MPHHYYKSPSKRSKWYLPKQEYRTVVSFCLQYKDLKSQRDELEQRIADVAGLRGVSYDGMPHGTDPGDPVFRRAVAIESDAKRLKKVNAKIELIENTVEKVSMELSYWMLKGITEEDATYEKLRYEDGMPLSVRAFTSMRREIYWLIAREL